MRILLVDDHQIVRQGLRCCLSANEQYQVVGEAQHGEEAVRMAQDLAPELVIMDLAMPGINGIQATRLMGGMKLPPKVVILSMHADSEFVTEALEAGASAYVLKESAFDELRSAIMQVMDGHTYISPNVAQDARVKAAIPRLADGTYPARDMGQNNIPRLTPREREVLGFLADGLSVKETAYKLGISDKTVHSFRAKLMTKLRFTSVAQLTKFAIRHGMTKLEE